MYDRLQYYMIFFGFFFIWPLAGMEAVQGIEISGALKTPISLSCSLSGISQSKYSNNQMIILRSFAKVTKPITQYLPKPTTKVFEIFREKYIDVL